MSKVMRSVKNVTKGYSSVQVKVREATSNDPWGPTGTQMSEISQLTYNSSTEFYDIVDMLDKRLNDKGKNWRHVLKALKVLDYCLHEGSAMIVTWARKNVYVIKTLREFFYIDEEGRDVGQNIRVAAKELTALIQDEDRLDAERKDRKSWKSRVTGIEEFAPHEDGVTQPRHQPRRQHSDEDDAEYKLALEASRFQEEEDRRKRESRQGDNVDDDDLAKAIKLSREEDERRRRELEESNASSLFDDGPVQNSQPQFTGMNMGYQQGSNVDWLGNPIDQNQMMQAQPTGFMNNAYTGFPNQNDPYQNGFGAQQTGYYDPYGQQNNQQAFGQQNNQFLAPQATQQPFQMQPTGFNNPYAQQQQAFTPQPTAPAEPVAQPGSNNPWASNKPATQQQPLQAAKTGSNNPFASGMARPQTARPSTAHHPPMPSLNNLQSLPEQKSLQTFTPPPMPTFQPPPQQPQQQQQPQKQLSDHEQKLNALLASGDGMDTYGNTGDLRIPAQHTAPGHFVNSAGAGASHLTANATGNPFLRQQFTGMPQISYGGQQNGGGNPFGSQPQQQPQGGQQNQDLIQF